MAVRTEAHDSQLLIVKRSQTEPIRFHGSPRPIFIVIGAVVRHGAYWTALKNLHSRNRTKTCRNWNEPSTRSKKNQCENDTGTSKRLGDNRCLNMLASRYTTPCLVSKKWWHHDLSPARDTESPAEFPLKHVTAENGYENKRGFTHLKITNMK